MKGYQRALEWFRKARLRLEYKSISGTPEETSETFLNAMMIENALTILSGQCDEWVVVPREATGRMLLALYMPIRNYTGKNCLTSVIEEGYLAMINAVEEIK